jgi:hypothetical protein
MPIGVPLNYANQVAGIRQSPSQDNIGGSPSEPPTAMAVFTWHSDDVKKVLDRIEEEIKVYIRKEDRKKKLAKIREFFLEITDNIQQDGQTILNPHQTKEYYGPFLYQNIHKMNERIRTGSKRDVDAILDVFRFIAEGLSESLKKIGGLGANSPSEIYKVLPRVFQNLISLNIFTDAPSIFSYIDKIGDKWPTPVYKHDWPRGQPDEWYRRVQKNRRF